MSKGYRFWHQIFHGKTIAYGPHLLFTCSVLLSFGGLSIILHQPLLDPQTNLCTKIIASAEVSRMGCFFSLYCVLTPILDEMTISVELLSVENGVWRKALVINSRVFAAAHFSREDMRKKKEREREGIQEDMGAFEDQVKMRAKELKHLFKKSIKVVGKSCKKGWSKVKNLRR
ncbi:hypothetical protein Bca52824_034937 [Brassica carinata]|uniref:Uncharacterized protein n=1 Tax=Brassica carinata TaxID=52824 RepID=A0A8X7S488_BRACI|nr:hypothetical protein Bca52824_034937 [Brassica carinata]